MLWKTVFVILKVLLHVGFHEVHEQGQDLPLLHCSLISLCFLINDACSS